MVILIGGNGLVHKIAEEMGLKTLALRYMVREISPLDEVKGYFELVRVLAELSPDLVHTHSAKAGMLGRLAARRLSLPVIHTAHGWPFTEGVSGLKKAIYIRVERFMALRCEKIITVSEYDRSIALAAGVSGPQQLITVHNGVPEIDFDTPANNKSGGGSPVRLIMVARFEQPKDHCLLLESLAPLRFLEWQLDLVGDGPTIRYARQKAFELKLSDRVNFLGSRDDVPELLAEADLLVLISLWEGLPLTILEGMRASLPVVASDVGGISELVNHGINGLLVPRSSARELTAALAEILPDADRMRAMGELGRKRYEEDFSFDQMLEKTLGAYYGVVRELV